MQSGKASSDASKRTPYHSEYRGGQQGGAVAAPLKGCDDVMMLEGLYDRIEIMRYSFEKYGHYPVFTRDPVSLLDSYTCISRYLTSHVARLYCDSYLPQ